jgi:hypothetical protein
MKAIPRRIRLSGSLYRLIYRSRNDIAGAVPDTDMELEIRAILDTARRNNATGNVTGALLLTATGFAQVLEGPRDVLERTYERICLDRRHTDATLLSFTPTERRCFPKWPMGFCGQALMRSADPLMHQPDESAVTAPLFAMPRSATGGDVLRLLEKVVRHEDEWIAA